MKRSSPKKKIRSAKTAPTVGSADFPAPFALLAHGVAPVRPPGKIKQALLERIDAESRPAAAPRGWRFDSAHRAEGWLTMPFPGVKMKELSDNPGQNAALVLIEIAPGARFPDHEHEFPDEGIILSGDAINGGRLLQAGDYYFADVGSKHMDTVSPSGCIAVVRLAHTVWQDLRSLAVAS